jgi:hypothetical protein
MLGDGIGRQQTQHALAGRLLLGLVAPAVPVAAPVLRGGAAKAQGE